MKFENKGLISEELWDRMINRIAKDNQDIDLNKAEIILNEALGFLKLCAENPGKGFAPSKQVDIGWHTFLMYTRDYQEFCKRVAGRFIHHEPNDKAIKSGVTVKSAIDFMKKKGIAFNEEMWKAKNEIVVCESQSCKGNGKANECGSNCNQSCGDKIMLNNECNGDSQCDSDCK